MAPDVDLAVLKVDAAGLPTLRLADYNAVRQGELVFAFGSPQGLRNWVTMGLVSAVARQPDPDSPMVYIQTDAAINPGNSGGALVNVAGELVGLNTFIVTQSGGSQGLGFAVPSAIVEVAWPQLRTYGHLHRGEIGLGLQSVTPALALALDLPRDAGLVVSDVMPLSSGAAAGIRVQDLIVSLDGQPIDSLFAMFCRSYARAAGDRLRLGILPGGEALSVDVEVGPLTDRLDRLGDDLDPEQHVLTRLGVIGLTVDEVTSVIPDLRLPFGVIVLGRSQRPAEADTLVAGDVIHALNGTLVSSFPGLDTALAGLARHSPVAL